MATVAVVIHSLVGDMSWAVAFALGAIVSPPDSVAATQIAGKLGLPRRLVTILGGEGMMNDATALTAYQVAIAAVGSAFTVADVFGKFPSPWWSGWPSASPWGGSGAACSGSPRRRSSRTPCC